MASTRLTKQMRDVILNALLNEAYEQRKSKLHEQSSALAWRVVEYRCGKDWRKKAAKIPENWLPETNRIEAKVGLRDVHLYLYGGKERLPYFGAYGDRNETPMEAESDLGAALLSYQRMAHNARDNEHEIAIQIKKNLASVATVEKLKEVWPEAHAKIPAEMLSAPGKQLAVNGEYLNKLLASFANAE